MAAGPPSRTDESTRAARQRAFEQKHLATMPRESAAKVTGEVPPELVTRVREHLARRTGGDPGTFQIVRTEQHQWPNGALGCPQPGLVYPQQVFDGFWIVLNDGKRDYDYRVTESGLLVMCEGMVLEDPPLG